MSGTCFTCAIEWQCPSCSRSTFRTWLWLCVPLLSSCSTGNSSPGSLPHIALLCGAHVLQSRKWPYTEDIHSSGCAGREEHLFSLMITGRKYLEDFFLATGSYGPHARQCSHSCRGGISQLSLRCVLRLREHIKHLGYHQSMAEGLQAIWRT